MTSIRDPRLTSDDYAAIAVELTAKLCEVITPSGQMTVRFPYPGAQEIQLDWPDTLAGHRLRLICRCSKSGVYPGLYVGDGNPEIGEGIVDAWSIYQETLRFTGKLTTCAIRRAPSAGGSPGDLVELRIDLEALKRLPGYDAALPDIVADVTMQVQWWMSHQLPASAKAEA